MFLLVTNWPILPEKKDFQFYADFYLNNCLFWSDLNVHIYEVLKNLLIKCLAIILCIWLMKVYCNALIHLKIAITAHYNTWFFMKHIVISVMLLTNSYFNMYNNTAVSTFWILIINFIHKKTTFFFLLQF